MVVSAGQGHRCYAAAAPCERVLEDRRHGPVEKAIALLLPHSVKRAVAWCVKLAVRTPEASAVLRSRPCFHAQLLVEEPAQFVHGIQAQWRREFLACRCLECGYVLREMLRRQ